MCLPSILSFELHCKLYCYLVNYTKKYTVSYTAIFRITLYTQFFKSYVLYLSHTVQCNIGIIPLH